jgi:hypothetical protein
MRSQAAPNTTELGRTVVTFSAETIHAAIARAASQALRAGIDGQYELADLCPAEDAACSPAVAAAERMVEKAQAQALAAFTALGLASLTDSRREGLQHSADRAAVALESAREELATVTRATHDASGASPRAIMDQFQTAIGALVKPGGKVSQLEAAALEKVFCDLSLRPVNAGQWAGRCFMRLPLADGSVLRCGPLEWDVTVPFAADSRRVALALGADGNFPWERHRARVRLEEAGLQRQQARMISDCGFRWLHPVVMHVVAGTPLPEGIPQDWTQPQFMSWAARVYTTRAWNWNGALHTYLRYGPQAVLDAVAQLGGSGCARDIAALIPPVTPAKVAVWMAMIDAVDDDGTRHWLVERARRSRTRQDGAGVSMALHRCRCGELISGIVDCPEVPARLLCRCRRMPFAEAFGMDPETRFPADYLRAIASPDDCRQYLARKRPRPFCLGKGEVAVLSSAIFDNDAWVTVAQIAGTVTEGVDRVASIMRQLETKGLVERHDTGESTRWNPRVWHRIRTIEEVDWKVHGR